MRILEEVAWHKFRLQVSKVGFLPHEWLLQNWNIGQIFTAIQVLFCTAIFSRHHDRTCCALSLLWRPWANILTVLPDSSTWNLQSWHGIQNPRLSSVDSLTWDEMTSKLEMALCQFQGLVIVCRNSTHASRALTSGYSRHAVVSYTVVIMFCLGTAVVVTPVNDLRWFTLISISSLARSLCFSGRVCISSFHHPLSVLFYFARHT